MTAKQFDTLAILVIAGVCVGGLVSALRGDASERLGRVASTIVFGVVMFFVCRQYMRGKYRRKAIKSASPSSTWTGASSPPGPRFESESPTEALDEDAEHDWNDQAESVIFGQVVFPIAGVLFLWTGIRWVPLLLSGGSAGFWDYAPLGLSTLVIVGLVLHFGRSVGLRRS